LLGTETQAEAKSHNDITMEKSLMKTPDSLTPHLSFGSSCSHTHCIKQVESCWRSVLLW